jgi:hypothetical protein
MDCVEALEALWTTDAQTPTLLAHLAGCRSCSLVAERSDWLDQQLVAAVLVTPPPAVLARAVAAARSAGPAALEATVRPVSLASYLLAGLVLLVAASLLADWNVPLARFASEVYASLWLVLTSPALWVLPSLAQLWGTMLGWIGVGVLAWCIRGLLAPADDVGRPGVR